MIAVTMRVLAAELHRVITEVEPFVSRDKTRPNLRVTRIEVGGGRLLAIGCDPWAIGVSSADTYVSPTEPPTEPNVVASAAFHLGADARKRVAQFARCTARGIAVRWVDITHLTGSGWVSMVDSLGSSINVPVTDVDYPAWRRLLPAEDDFTSRHPVTVLAVAAGNLAKLAKVLGVPVGVRISEDGPGPGVIRMVTRARLDAGEDGGAMDIGVAFTVGTHFAGLFMPYRMRGQARPDGYHMPEWVRP